SFQKRGVACPRTIRQENPRRSGRLMPDRRWRVFSPEPARNRCGSLLDLAQQSWGQFRCARFVPVGRETACSWAQRPRRLMERQRLEIGIYQLADDALLKANRSDGSGWDWGWAPPQRDWMDATPSRYAYRCLPLTIV